MKTRITSPVPARFPNATYEVGKLYYSTSECRIILCTYTGHHPGAAANPEYGGGMVLSEQRGGWASGETYHMGYATNYDLWPGTIEISND